MTALAQAMTAAGIQWRPLTYHKRPTLAATAWDIAVGYARALSVCAREPIRIVHARSYVAGLIAWLVTRTVGAKFLFDIRGFWPDERVEGGLGRAAGSMGSSSASRNGSSAMRTRS